MSRTKKSAWNFASGFVFTAVTVCVGVFSTPILLQWLGDERFGVFRVLTDLATYLPLIEFGLGGALSARLALALGENDKTKVERLLATGLRYCFRIAILMLAVGIILLFALPVLIETNHIQHKELQTAWLILLVGCFYYPLSVFSILLEARQLRYVLNILYTSQGLLTTILLLIAAWLGWGLSGQSAATVLAQAPAILIIIWLGSRAYKIDWLAKPDEGASKSLRTLNWSVFFYHTGFRIGILSDNIVVSLIINPLAVVPFFLTQRLAMLAQNQLLSVGSSTWAGLVELHAQGEAKIFYVRLLELTNFVSSLSLAALAPIAAYNKHFIARWVGEDKYAGASVTLVVCFNVWMWAVLYLWGWVLHGTGQLPKWTHYAIAFIFINLSVSILGTFTLGLVGPPLGTMAGFIFVNAWSTPLLLKKQFDWSPLELWTKALIPFIWALPYGAFLWWFARTRQSLGWVQLFVEFGVSGLGSLVLWGLIGMSSAERQNWLQRLKVIVG